MIKFINNFISKFFHNLEWEYGTCYSEHEGRPRNVRKARRNKYRGNVQFVIWKIGDKQGDYVYTEDFWIDYDYSWFKNFKKDL